METQTGTATTANAANGGNGIAAASAARAEQLSEALRRIRESGTTDPTQRIALTAGMRKLPRLHAAHTLSEEHQFILGSLRELASFVDRLEGIETFSSLGSDLEVLRGIAHHLVEAESHHQREEEVLFPRIEARGVSFPTSIMRQDHEKFRSRKRRLYQLAQAAPDGEFAPFKAEVREIGLFITRELAEHIFQEDTIVYQIALEVLPEEEWVEVKRLCDAIGYCCFKPEDAQEPPRPVVDIDLRTVPMVRRLDTILSAWKGLDPGQAMRIRNDREPGPLLLLLRATEKGRFDWTYEAEGPTEWIARITRLAGGEKRDRKGE